MDGDLSSLFACRHPFRAALPLQFGTSDASINKTPFCAFGTQSMRFLPGKLLLEPQKQILQTGVGRSYAPPRTRKWKPKFAPHRICFLQDGRSRGRNDVSRRILAPTVISVLGAAFGNPRKACQWTGRISTSAKGQQLSPGASAFVIDHV